MLDIAGWRRGQWLVTRQPTDPLAIDEGQSATLAEDIGHCGQSEVDVDALAVIVRVLRGP